MNDFKIYIKDKNPSFYKYLSNGQKSIQYDKIIDIITEHQQYEFLTNKDLYDMIMYEIKKLTDMKIKLNNGDIIYAYQPIIKTIPYFKLLLQDAQDDSWSRYREIYVDFEPFAIKEIINSLYTTINLNFSNIIPIMILMDKLLYYQPIREIISFLENHMDTMIKMHMQDENIENLIMMETILYNMIYAKSKHQYNDKTIYDLIKKFNVCEKYFFSFTHWFDIFNPQQQYDAIIASKNYNLFNKSTIEPRTVMYFFILKFPESHCFYNIMNRFSKFSPPCIYYNHINEYIGHHYITLIKSYYPIFSYILLDPLIENVTINETTFKTNINQSYKNINIGSQLIISNDLSSYQKEYTIIEINKWVDDKKYKTNHLMYTDLLNIEYEIVLDKVITDDKLRCSTEENKIWLKREFNINVL